MKEEIKNFLNSFQPSQGEYSLENIKRVAEELFIDINDLPFTIIQIVGTNGKGTTAFLLERYLNLNNKKVGLYTSPHIIDIKERIRINSHKISDELLLEIINYIKNQGRTQDVEQLKLF